MEKTVKVSIGGDRIKKLAQNALVFTAPALIMFLEALRQGLSFDKAKYILILAAYGLVIDFLKKFITVQDAK